MSRSLLVPKAELAAISGVWKIIHSCVEVAPANFVTEASIASYATDYVHGPIIL